MYRFLCLLLIQFVGFCFSQTNAAEKNVEKMAWKNVVRRMPAEWYGTKQALAIADQLIARQMDNGGWQKNIPYHRLLSEKKLAEVRRSGVGSTIDNGATTLEMLYLAKVYGFSKDQKYKDSFLKAFQYLLDAQYDNGGWPQFFPPRKNVGYSSHITYNDDAYVNVMWMLRNIYENKKPYNALNLSESVKDEARKAFNKGIDCILKTQIKVDGHPTVWCAQHDEKTFEPAAARAYELPSFSGAESVGIVRLLMSLPNPSKEVICAVKGAVDWFEKHEVKNMKVDRFEVGEKKFDAHTVPAEGAVMWARFYDLDTEKPFFCDRDGVKKDKLEEIGRERRGGYSWYTTSPQGILDEYPEWLAKVEKAK